MQQAMHRPIVLKRTAICQGIMRSDHKKKEFLGDWVHARMFCKRYESLQRMIMPSTMPQEKPSADQRERQPII